MGKRYPQTIREKAKQNKKIHRPRNLNWHKPSASIFPLAQQKWAADLRQWEWVCITPCSKKNFSEHFVGKKLLTQERRINRDCSNPCYKWDGPSFSPSCIAGNPPRELFWTQRFSRAWCTNHVTQITGSCIKCSVSIFFYRRAENFHAWSRTESPDAQLSCSSPGLAAGPILAQPAALGDITC